MTSNLLPISKTCSAASPTIRSGASPNFCHRTGKIHLQNNTFTHPLQDGVHRTDTILAKQLIAAKLNIANGVEASEDVLDAIDSADELIGSATIPMSVKPRTTLGKQMTGVAGFLESYNKGELTEGCSLSKSGVTEETGMTQLLPDVYVLDQNYPNPFNPTTQIRFGIPEAGNVALKSYNSAGQLVKTLVDGNMSAGFHQVTWDATDNRGIKLSSGVYFYRITAGTFTQMNKMVLMK